jgi:hypothetical protein
LGHAEPICSDLGQRKVALLAAVTADLTAKIKAGDIIKHIAPILGREVPRNRSRSAAIGASSASVDSPSLSSFPSAHFERTIHRHVANSSRR